MAQQADVARLIRNLDGFAADIEEVRLSGQRSVAFGMKRQIEAVARSSGVRMRLSGVGRRGAALGVTVQKQADGAYKVSGDGPWQFVEGPTKPHSLAPRRRPPRRYARFANGQVRQNFRRGHHPGTRGKRIWQRAFAKTRDEALDTYRTGVANAQRRRFS
jgi:hypothetical protein